MYEILQITLNPRSAEESLYEKGIVIIRIGDDYCGEVNIENESFSNREKLNMRVAFLDTEQEELDSGIFNEKEQIAGIFIPNSN